MSAQVRDLVGGRRRCRRGTSAQRSASSASPMASAASASASSARRKPWLGAWSAGIGPLAAPARAAQRVETAVVARAGVRVGGDRVAVVRRGALSASSAHSERRRRRRGDGLARVGAAASARRARRRPGRRRAAGSGRDRPAGSRGSCGPVSPRRATPLRARLQSSRRPGPPFGAHLPPPDRVPMIEIATSPTTTTLAVAGDLDLAERDQFPEIAARVVGPAPPAARHRHVPRDLHGLDRRGVPHLAGRLPAASAAARPCCAARTRGTCSSSRSAARSTCSASTTDAPVRVGDRRAVATSRRPPTAASARPA